MIDWLYTTFGFWASVTLMLFIFLFFIFWMAGVSGISSLPDADRSKDIKLIISVVIPIYPVAWLILDIVQNKKRLDANVR